MKDIKTKQELDEVLAENKKVLVKIGAEWCGPCKMLEKYLTELEEQFPDVKIVKADCDEADELVELFDVMSVPLSVYYVDGEIKAKKSGLMTKEQLKELFEDDKN